MGKEHCNESYKALKLLSYQVKATTYLKGTVKNQFLNECIVRGGNEATTLRDIVTLHFEILDKIGASKGCEYSDVLKHVTKNKY